MTEGQICDLFTLWQGRLGLGEWSIRVDFEKIDPAATIMEIHHSRNYQLATIKVNDWVLTGTPPEDWNGHAKGAITDLDIEEAVVHELLHAVIGPLWIGINILRGESHRDAHDVAVSVFDSTEENVVDRLAVALVRAWPAR
jgi:hypothetical protein